MSNPVTLQTEYQPDQPKSYVVRALNDAGDVVAAGRDGQLFVAERAVRERLAELGYEVKEVTTTSDEAMQKLSPIKKVNFKRWHSEGQFRLVWSGAQSLPAVVETISDYKHDWINYSQPTSKGPDMHKHEKAYMFSNGVQEFVLVINDMQASNYSRQTLEDTGKHHVIIYLVAGKET